MYMSFFRNIVFSKVLKFIYIFGWLLIILGFTILLISDSTITTTRFILVGLYLFAFRFLILLLLFPFPHIEPDWSLVYPELAEKDRNGRAQIHCREILPRKYLFLLFLYVDSNRTMLLIHGKLFYLRYLILTVAGIIFMFNGLCSFSLTLLILGGLLYGILLLHTPQKEEEPDWTLVYPELSSDCKTKNLNKISFNNLEEPSIEEWNDCLNSLQIQLNETMHEFFKFENALEKEKRKSK